MLNTLCWFHGTSVRYADQIQREGLRPLSENGLDSAKPPQLCVTTRWDVALTHARLMAEYEACAPLVWCIPAHSLGPEAFGLDYTVVRLGPSGNPSADSIAAYKRWRSTGITPTPESLWRETGHGSVSCTVPPHLLVPIWISPWGQGGTA